MEFGFYSFTWKVLEKNLLPDAKAIIHNYLTHRVAHEEAEHVHFA